MQLPKKTTYCPIEDSDLRDALIALREKWFIPRFPQTSREKGLLRRRMIDELLRYKPADHAEFFTMLPWEIVSETDWAQIGHGLDIVLAEMNRLLGRRARPAMASVATRRG